MGALLAFHIALTIISFATGEAQAGFAFLIIANMYNIAAFLKR